MLRIILLIYKKKLAIKAINNIIIKHLALILYKISKLKKIHWKKIDIISLKMFQNKFLAPKNKEELLILICYMYKLLNILENHQRVLVLFSNHKIIRFLMIIQIKFLTSFQIRKEFFEKFLQKAFKIKSKILILNHLTVLNRKILNALNVNLDSKIKWESI